MARMQTTIQKQHGPVVPEAGWKMAGMTPIGQQLYTESIPRSRAVPDYEQIACLNCVGDECRKCSGTGIYDGPRIWIKNPLTNAPLYKKNKPEFYTQERMFFIESDGAFNQYKVDWAPPTPEQIEAIRHAKQVAEMVPALASALVDKGLDVDEIVARLTAPAVEEVIHAPEEVAGALPATDAEPDEEL